MVELLDGVPCRLVHDLQQSLLLLQHLAPLDLDLDGLALACGRHSGLLQHGCAEPQILSVQLRPPSTCFHACMHACIMPCNVDYALRSMMGGTHLLRVEA